ncbi:DUF6777 domain-containing protein [Streptomyces sp. NPDC058676]|uniref:DUF6777 domain-containing protein n=1 Tax=unclassified Streptomyces TaxID=2593676 RepID=UPI0036589BD7
MSVEPPSSGRPTGPPSGPLSGPSQPPSGPPSQPPGSGGAHEPEPGRPWWRSVPRVAVLATLVVAAVVLAVVFTRSDGGGSAKGGEVFLQAAGKTGPDPYTESTATDSSAPPLSASPTTESAPANAVRGVDGGAPGLYGGTRNVSSCDVEKQITALRAAPPKNRAFASVARVAPSEVPAYLRSLTPLQLRMDTRVTNHGYRDGSATSYQAVLQSGTAVLVDDHGVPRVRCACGNPLTPPVALQATPRRTGDSWPSYNPANVVVVAPSAQVVNIFVIYDPDRGDWFARHRGDTGGKDKKTQPPAHQPKPSVSRSTSTAPSSPSSEPSSSKPSPSEPSSSKPSPSKPSPSEPATLDPDPSEPEPPASSPQAPLAPDTTTQSGPAGSHSTAPVT